MSEDLATRLASLKVDRPAQASPRSGRRGLGLTALLGGMVALGTVASSALPSLRARFSRVQVATTHAYRVAARRASFDVSATGYIVPETVSRVGAKSDARLAEVRVREGAQVQAGEVIALLEADEVRGQLRIAEARIAVARARVGTARAQLVEGRQKLERQRRLLRHDVATAATVEEIEAQVQSLTAEVSAAEAQVLVAEAEASHLQAVLESLTVTAPISGTVIGRPAAIGELVGPMTGPILELADLSQMVVEVDVPEAKLSHVALDAPCQIVVDALPGREILGRVLSISPRINRAKATAKVKVSFVDGPSETRFDMAARVNFLSEEPPPPNGQPSAAKLIVPASAILREGDTSYLFVIEQGVAHKLKVQLSERLADGFELLSGLPDDAQLVDAPPPGLADGQMVSPKLD